MGFEKNKNNILHFFTCLDWQENKKFAHEIIHPDYPQDKYTKYKSSAQLDEMKKGPEGWLERNIKKLPGHEILNIFGNDRIIIAEYFLQIDPTIEYFSDIPTDFEPFKILGYHTFEFQDGKIIGMRNVWDYNFLRSKLPSFDKSNRKRIENYISKIMGLELA